MMSLSSVQKMCQVVGGSHQSHAVEEGAFTLAHVISPARCLGLGSQILFSWFMQRNRAQHHGPSGVGVLDGMLAGRWWGWCVCVR